MSSSETSQPATTNSAESDTKTPSSDLEKAAAAPLIELELENENNAIPQPRTTKRELWGWWLYDWANSVYSSVALGILIPLVIEDLAWNAGTDPSTGLPCPARNSTTADNIPCFVPWAGGYARPSSYAFYITAISVGVQAFLFCSIGSLADYGNSRKRMLMLFAVLGPIFCLLFLSVTKPQLYWVIGLFAVLSNVCFGASIVFYNSFLPLLVENHPEFIEAVEGIVSKEKAGEETLEQAKADLLMTRDRLGNRISTHGFAMGYASGIILLGVTGGVLFAFDGTYAMQAMIAVSGLWWLGFAIFTFAWVHPRPRPPLPAGEKYFIFSWKKIIRTFGHLPKLKDTFIYLGGYFIFSDAINTTSSVATLFGRVELKMTSTQLLVVAIIPPIGALIGNYIWLWISRRFHWSSKTAVLVILGCFLLIPIYGLIGYSGVFGIVKPVELYVAAAWYGLQIGAIQSFSRVLMAELVPPGSEAEFFSLYEVTDKGSSWMGPLIVAAIYDKTGNFRDAFWFLLAATLLPIPIIWFVNMNRGREAAKSFKLE